MWLKSTAQKPPQNNKYIDFQLTGVAAKKYEFESTRHDRIT